MIKKMKNTIHSFRLKPKSDLKKSLFQFLKKNKIQAGIILSSVGSLSVAQIRLANDKKAKKVKGPLEIIHLNGTVSLNGCHLHICVADHQGKMQGGHLLDGSLVYTTCELVVLQMKNQIFTRKFDNQTQYNELSVQNLK